MNYTGPCIIAQPITGLGSKAIPHAMCQLITGLGSDSMPACNAVKILPIKEPAETQKDEEREDGHLSASLA